MAVDWDLVLKLAEMGGNVASAAGSGRAAGRAAENTAAQDRYRTEQAAKLGAANLTERAVEDRADRYLNSGKTRAQQVGLGELLQNVQPVSISGLPDYIPKVSFGGGLTPAALGPLTRQSGGALARQALEAQLSGADVPNLPDVSSLGQDAPELKQGGSLDSILNYVGAAGAGLGGYNEITREREKAKQDAADKAASRAQMDKLIAAVSQGQGQAAGVPATVQGRTTPNQMAQLLALTRLGPS